MKRNLRMLSFFMALLMVCLCIPVVALDSFATGDSITQTEHDGTDAVSNDTNLDGTQVEDMLLEDVSKRDAFTKHYDLGNGSYYAVVFPEQVHYFENDQWVEIDNSLQYNSASGRYESANQIFSTGFAPNATAGDAVSVTNGDYTVSWSLIFEGGDNHLQSEEQGPILAQPIQITNGQAFEMNAWELDSGTGTIGKAASSVIYADLQNGSVDVRYSVYHGKVKEDVILESADALTSYALVMDTDGLIAIQNDDNSVSFVDAQGEVFFTMGAPWMQDSDAGVSHDVAVEVMQKGNQAIIAYTPDAEWLQAEERVYPVLIDPSFTANYYTCNIVDTYVYTGDSASATRANESILRVGYVNSKTYAAYMKFENLPDFSSYAVITDAQLDFYVNTTSSPELSVYEADGAWDPATITYANQPLEGNMLVYSTSGYATGNVSQYSLSLSTLLDYTEYGDATNYLVNYWDGLKIVYEGAYSSNYTDIFSAQYTTNMDYRPTLRLTYTYYPGTEIANGAVYSFKNAANGEYMTVNSSSNYASAGLASKSTTLWKQSFRLAWDSSVGAYNIHALTTSGQSTSYVLSGDSDIVYSDYAEDLYLYQKQTSRAEDQGWVIDHVQNGLYRIINAAHPELAVTGCTNDDYYDLTMGIAYEGNVCIMPYTGATNQLWRLESGGVQIVPSLNIRNSPVFEKSENSSYQERLSCPVMNLGDTVTWSSPNIDIATVDANGVVTALSAGSVQLTAMITKADGTKEYYHGTMYVVMANGIYYFNAMGSLSSSYRIECDSTENVTVPEGTELILRNSGTGEPTTRAGLFKIRHLGEGQYSIRSMLDNRMGLMYSSTDVYLGNVGTSADNVPTNARWIIHTNDSGYYVRGANTGNSLTLPNVVNDGVEVGWSTYHSNYLNYNWFITKSTQTIHGIDITQKTDTLVLGDTFQFGAVFYSTTGNINGQNLVWDIDENSSTGSADIDSNGVLTPISTGAVTVTVTYTRSSTQQWSDSWMVNIFVISPSGYEVPYAPELWNYSPVMAKTNCYAYALNNQVIPGTNELDYRYMQPGALAGYTIVRAEISASLIQSYVEQDALELGFRFEEIEKHQSCSPGAYKVALVIAPGVDYHWYRQNPDGTWSHKRGGSMVINYDASGNIIYDPEIADRMYSDELNYSVFAGFFEVTPLNNFYVSTRSLENVNMEYEEIQFESVKMTLPSVAQALTIQKDMPYSEVSARIGLPQRMRTFGIMVVEYDLASGDYLIVEYVSNLSGEYVVQSTSIEYRNEVTK